MESGQNTLCVPDIQTWIDVWQRECAHTRNFGRAVFYSDADIKVYLSDKWVCMRNVFVLKRNKFWTPARVDACVRVLVLAEDYADDFSALNFADPDMPRIEFVRFNASFNQCVDNLPPSVRFLSFGSAFDQPIDALPPGVEYISTGTFFQQRVDLLPASLRCLRLGWSYSRPIDHLPRDTCVLVMGRSFNQPVPCLPPALRAAFFGTHFAQPLLRVPRGVQVLALGNMFRGYVPNTPPTLRVLFVGRHTDTPVPPHVRVIGTHAHDVDALCIRDTVVVIADDTT